MIYPTEFIPLAESIGLIVPIGKWVLKRVCKQIKSWRDAGINSLTVAVNLSVIEFNQPDFIHQMPLVPSPQSPLPGTLID
jgi:EAL domain-containing protein (putative c-di-GMP-specific phosphodiesterase class I)